MEMYPARRNQGIERPNRNLIDYQIKTKILWKKKLIFITPYFHYEPSKNQPFKSLF